MRKINTWIMWIAKVFSPIRDWHFEALFKSPAVSKSYRAEPARITENHSTAYPPSS